MTADDEARRRLARAMDDRRVELRLKWTQVAQRADMSIAHLSRIRNNEAPLTDLAQANLEAALEWPRGAIGRILAVESAPAPTPHTSASEADQVGVSRILAIVQAQQREIEALRATVEELQRDRGMRQSGPDQEQSERRKHA